MNKFIYTILACLTLGTSVFTLSSCQDDDDYNTKAATVGMGKTTFSVKENKGIFTIPVVATGDRNGDVLVNVEVEPVGNDCVENEHFIVTSKKIIIPKSKESANVEIKAIDNRAINADRSFIVKIVSVKGASCDDNLASTTVILLDNDNNPYERLAGNWTVTAYVDDTYTETYTWNTTITTVDEDDDAYGKELIVSPWVNDDYTFLSHVMHFKYDASSEKVSLVLPLGKTMGEGLDFGKDDLNNDFSSASIISASINGATNSMLTNGSYAGEVSSDFTTITFNLPFLGLIMNEQGQTMQTVANGYTYISPLFYFTKMVFTLKD